MAKKNLIDTTKPGLELIQEYARLGFRLLPIRASGKQPTIRDWPAQASNDWGVICEWLQRWPSANWAIATGADAGGQQFAVLDIDRAAVEAGWPGGERRRELKTTRCPLTRTPHNGYHAYFRAIWPNSVGVIAPGVDTKGSRGCVVVPPSRIGGVSYKWLRPLARVEDMPQPPGWLTQAVAEATRKVEAVPPCRPGIAGPGAESLADQGGILPEGSRNSGLTRFAGRLRRVGLSEAEIYAALLVANRIRCRPPLPDNEVAGIAKSVSRYPAGTLAASHLSHAMRRSLRQAVRSTFRKLRKGQA